MSDAETEKRKLVRNERLKASATLLNNIATAFMVGGLIALTIAAAYGATQSTGGYWWSYAVLWIICAVGAHLAARFGLGSLEP